MSFTASDTTIDLGDSVVISWVTRNGDTRLLASSPPTTTYENQAASGNRTFTPTVTSTYRIQVWNAVDPAGTLDERVLTVTVAQPAPVIDSFSISPTTIDSGDDVQFEWTTTNAVRVRVHTSVGFSTVVIFNSSSADGSRTEAISVSPGSYTITLLAYNADDALTGTTRTLTVN